MLYIPSSSLQKDDILFFSNVYLVRERIHSLYNIYKENAVKPSESKFGNLMGDAKAALSRKSGPTGVKQIETIFKDFM